MIEGKLKMNRVRYFCVCERCGAVDWFEDEGIPNGLTEEGQLLSDNRHLFVFNGIRDLFWSGKTKGSPFIDKRKDLWRHFSSGFPCCAECENLVSPLLFTEFNKKERKKVWAMSRNKRTKWIKGVFVLDSLKE